MCLSVRCVVRSSRRVGQGASPPGSYSIGPVSSTVISPAATRRRSSSRTIRRTRQNSAAVSCRSERPDPPVGIRPAPARLLRRPVPPCRPPKESAAARLLTVSGSWLWAKQTSCPRIAGMVHGTPFLVMCPQGRQCMGFAGILPKCGPAERSGPRQGWNVIHRAAVYTRFHPVPPVLLQLVTDTKVPPDERYHGCTWMAAASVRFLPRHRRRPAAKQPRGVNCFQALTDHGPIRGAPARE